MERFTQMLATGLQRDGEAVEVWKPVVCFGRFAKSTLSGFGKWLGYLDKWILFPILLHIRRRSFPTARFHVCDHSNAPYLGHLPPNRTSITCHDVLAIRGAMGFADSYCPASRAGKILQRWILSHLSKCNRIAVDSEMTMCQLVEISKQVDPKSQWQVIHVGFNDLFEPMNADDAMKILVANRIAVPNRFLLHVGSSLPRKNRRMLLRMVPALGSRWDGKIVFAGQAMNTDLRSEALALGLSDGIIEATSLNHETLVALYSRCEVFVFPSYSEGFGWPLIEAQACGAPVIASNLEPMPEVGGDGAIYASPDDVDQFVEAFMQFQPEAVRSSLIQKGFENCKRFDPKLMIDKYRALIYSG